MSDTMRGAPESLKIEPGTDMHLTLLMAPDSLNLVVGEDRAALLRYGKRVWQAAQSQPAPPAPQSVQDIMRMMMPWVAACVQFNNTPMAGIEYADDKVKATFKPLEAALTAIVEERDRLKFELDGVLAMRRPMEWTPIESAPKDGPPILVMNAQRGGCWVAKYFPVYQSGYRPENPWSSLMLNCDWHLNRYASMRPTHWQPLPLTQAPTGIAPEQGENHG